MAFSLKQLIPFLNPATDLVSDANLRNTQKINELFQLLKESRTVLNISLPGTNKSFTSNILAVDTESRKFVLDEIFPEDGHTLFENIGKLAVHAEIRGARISFEACRLSSEYSRRISSYSCQIPESISYSQRRAEHRVLIHPAHLIQFSAKHQNTNQILQGHLYDISMQGIGIVFKATHIIKPGDQLQRCQLTLSTKETVSFTLDVRHIESTIPGCIKVGGSFRELDSRSRDIVGRFVRQMERTIIKS
ncbi:MAG: flagellar brake protein [Gammaproteobacteria bacterium]|nr:flagellar brake protein [Gammaproteobacteria bacterium]